jgi:hypothetical protein
MAPGRVTAGQEFDQNPYNTTNQGKTRLSLEIDLGQHKTHGHGQIQRKVPQNLVSLERLLRFIFPERNDAVAAA